MKIKQHFFFIWALLISFTLPSLAVYADTVPVITKNPVAITGLVYNGQAQALVTAGEVKGGTFYYALGNANGATGTYTTSIPTATNAGTYYVWYKAIGDETHSDSGVAGPVKVVINEPEPEKTYKVKYFQRAKKFLITKKE